VRWGRYAVSHTQIAFTTDADSVQSGNNRALEGELDKTPDFASESSRSSSYLGLGQLITVAGVSND
jgi:hypothetical protein